MGGWIIGELAELGALSAMLATTVRGGALAVFGRAHVRGVDLLANLSDARLAALAIVDAVNVLIGATRANLEAALRDLAAATSLRGLAGAVERNPQFLLIGCRP